MDRIGSDRFQVRVNYARKCRIKCVNGTKEEERRGKFWRIFLERRNIGGNEDLLCRRRGEKNCTFLDQSRRYYKRFYYSFC